MQRISKKIPKYFLIFLFSTMNFSMQILCMNNQNQSNQYEHYLNECKNNQYSRKKKTQSTLGKRKRGPNSNLANPNPTSKRPKKSSTNHQEQKFVREEGEFICECGDTFSFQDSINGHLTKNMCKLRKRKPKRKKRAHKCSCGATTSSSESMSAHKNRCKLNPKAQRETCVFCQRTFASSSNLKKHIKNNCRKSPNAKKRKGPTCTYCGTHFTCKSSVTKHVREICNKNTIEKKQRVTELIVDPKKLSLAFILN